MTRPRAALAGRTIVAHLARAKWLAKITRLDLEKCGLGDEGLKALVGSPLVAGLQELDLEGNDLTAEGARAIAESPYLGKLKSLRLISNRIGDEDGQVFYGHSFLADPRGDLVAELGSGVTGVALAGFDLDAIARTRAAFGFFRDRRPDLYGAISTRR